MPRKGFKRFPKKSREPKTWEWDQAIVIPENVAATKADFAKNRWMIKDTLVITDADGLSKVLIVVSRGTAIPKVEAEPKADDESREG